MQSLPRKRVMLLLIVGLAFSIALLGMLKDVYLTSSSTVQEIASNDNALANHERVEHKNAKLERVMKNAMHLEDSRTETEPPEEEMMEDEANQAKEDNESDASKIEEEVDNDRDPREKTHSGKDSPKNKSEDVEKSEEDAIEKSEEDALAKKSDEGAEAQKAKGKSRRRIPRQFHFIFGLGKD